MFVFDFLSVSVVLGEWHVTERQQMCCSFHGFILFVYDLMMYLFVNE